ncbi:hypothetical protein [Aquimarina algiphila]|uniref:hypothetical protein n=1 Tax=Aquimarina algiphila TaxID=2047982 RepID=UPI00232DD0D5|nr:hypothetical protein [Aquimarina algiphila]
MKRLEEIELMLISEFKSNLDKIKILKPTSKYYNEILGDTSFLLAGLLNFLLNSDEDWNPNKWIDDSLLTKVKLDENKLSIQGVMIWGLENITEQWTDPFYFEIKLNQDKPNFDEYTFLYCDLNRSEISYEDFNINPNYWKTKEIEWRYIINQKPNPPDSSDL